MKNLFLQTIISSLEKKWKKLYYMQPENGVNFDYSKSVKISNTVYWVGHYDKKVKVQHNSSLI